MEKKTTAPRGGYLEALLTSCPVPILSINNEGMITFVNKEASNLAEREMREIIGSNIADFYESLEAARETNRKMYASGGVVHDHESRVRTKSGKIINVRISASHLKDSAGNYIGAVGYFEPYRPWTSAEKQLKAEVEQMKVKLEKCNMLDASIVEICSGLSVVTAAGYLDSKRVEDLNNKVLEHIEQKKVKVMLINLSSAVVDDDGMAKGLVKTVRTARLLGAECLLTGVKTSFARIMEALLEDISSIHSFQSMDDALRVALNKVGYEI